MLLFPETVLSMVKSSDLCVVPLYDLLSIEAVADSDLLSIEVVANSELTPGERMELLTNVL